MFHDFFYWYIRKGDIDEVIAIARSMKITIHNNGNNEIFRNVLCARLLKPNFFNKAHNEIRKRYKKILDIIGDGKQLEEIKTKQEAMIEEHGYHVYFLCLAVIADSVDNVYKDEWDKYMNELRNMYILKSQNTDAVNYESDETAQMLKNLKEEIVVLQQKVTLTEKKTINFEKKLKIKEKEIVALSIQKRHQEDKYIIEQDKLKGQIIDVRQKYQEATSKFKENENLLNEQIKSNIFLKTELINEQKISNQLKEENRELKISLEQFQRVVQVWEACYPNEDPMHNYFNVLVIGNEEKEEIIYVNGRPVKKYSMDADNIIRMCHKKEFLIKYDLALVDITHCDGKQWNVLQEKSEQFAKIYKQVYSPNQVIERIEQSL